MNRAFVKEPDGSDAYDELPDRPIGPEPNLVTRRGLARIDEEIARLQALLADAQAEQARARIAEATRDLRYWTARRATAEVVPPPADTEVARFGHVVTLALEDDSRRRFRIVGQDEAEPKDGRISFLSPLARALLGRRRGDAVAAPWGEAEIVAIDLPDT